jgi:hypothetical protein
MTLPKPKLGMKLSLNYGVKVIEKRHDMMASGMRAGMLPEEQDT